MSATTVIGRRPTACGKGPAPFTLLAGHAVTAWPARSRAAVAQECVGVTALDHFEQPPGRQEVAAHVLGTRLNAGESNDDIVRRGIEAAKCGIEHLGVVTTGPWTSAGLDTLAAAIPALRGVEPSG